MNVPEEIQCSDQIFDLSFHPKFNVLATGIINGKIELWKYGETNESLFVNAFHRQSCRGVQFNQTGDQLMSISADKSIQIIDGTGSQVCVMETAHEDSINRICTIDEQLIATGDDGGVVKLWDTRNKGKECMAWKVHEDYIAGLDYFGEKNTLLSIGGDARLCAYDIRNKKKYFKSDDQESELQCLQVFKGGNKVLCGSQEGVLLVFSWGKWGDCSDRVLGHPQAVNCMLKVDENTVLTGSSDGMIRVVEVQPNKILGVIGDHEEFPVEGMCTSFDSSILGTFAHDEVVRFWDISMFGSDEADDELAAAEEMAWEDAEEENEEEEEAQGGTMESEADGDSSSSRDDEDLPKEQSGKRIMSQREQFYADL